jgi:hypothetical protein
MHDTKFNNLNRLNCFFDGPIKDEEIHKSMTYDYQDWNGITQDNIFENHEDYADYYDSCFRPRLLSVAKDNIKFQEKIENNVHNLDHNSKLCKDQENNDKNAPIMKTLSTTCEANLAIYEKDILLENKIEILTSPFRRESKPNKSKGKRRDVINKTIIRIIRRYFLSILEKMVPDYKIQKRNNMIQMLESLVYYLFPENRNSLNLAYVLSALLFRGEYRKAKIDDSIKAEMQVYLDIQSKFAHKLFKIALENPSFRTLFSYFLENGMESFSKDENVMKNSNLYTSELERMKSQYYKSQ